MRALAFLAAFSTLSLASCAPDPVLNVRDAWVRLPATPGNPGAAYFYVSGGPKTDRLMSVSSPVVIRTELHESMAGHSGMMTMKPIEGGVEVPAGGFVEFKPGGKHAMLYNINPGIQPPRTVPMVFTFASGARITADAQVKLAGDK
jgi:periplasmic copper chaperone A